MTSTALIAVLSIITPGYIANDLFTTGKGDVVPSTSLKKAAGSWSTKHERGFTDSPLIEWTILQKTSEVSDNQHTVDVESTEEFTQTTMDTFDIGHDSNSVVHDVTESQNDVINDVTFENVRTGRHSSGSWYSENAVSETTEPTDTSETVISDTTVELTTYSANIDTGAEDYSVSTSPTETSRDYPYTPLHKISEDCVYDISRKSGEIIYPDNDNFPRANSSEVLTCKWRIRTPDGPNIRLHFRKLDLELGSEYLELAVGMGGNKATRLITGSKLPSDIIVEGTELWLTLKSRQKDGFTLLSLTFEESTDNQTFPVTDNTTCGGLLVELEGNVSSPGFPNNYDTNEECTWFIAAPAHSVIQITILEFKTEVYDQVRIGVGLLAKAPASRLLTLFGELMHERETIVPANSLWINFYSDDTVTAKGFFIQYKIIPRDICNTSNVFDTDTGMISSVNYPNPYPINSECTWTILGKSGAYINMTFHDLRIQDGRDFVLVGQGKEVFDGPFTTYTGNISRTFTLTVKASNAWLHFTSDHIQGGDGFRGFNLSFVVFQAGDHAGRPITSPGELLIEEREDTLPRKDVLVFRLRGVNREHFESRLPEFREELTRLVNERCRKSISCSDGDNVLRTGDVEIVSLTSQAEQLVVEVIIRTAISGDYAMDSLDYDELEKLFHTDLQTLDLQHGQGDGGSSAATKLPEWLIGVIVVVILLIFVFFAMVIYSLVKERKKQRAGSYGGNTSSASMCDEVEVGKDDGNIRITSFIVDNEKAPGNGWVDTEASTLQRRPQQGGVHGCMNPAFVDDDDQAKPKSAEKKKSPKPKETVKQNTSTETKEKPVDVEPCPDNGEIQGDAKSNTAVKEENDSTEETGETEKEEKEPSETHEAEVNEDNPTTTTTTTTTTEPEAETQKDSSTETCTGDREDHPDLSTNL